MSMMVPSGFCSWGGFGRRPGCSRRSIKRRNPQTGQSHPVAGYVLGVAQPFLLNRAAGPAALRHVWSSRRTIPLGAEVSDADSFLTSLLCGLRLAVHKKVADRVPLRQRRVDRTGQTHATTRAQLLLHPKAPQLTSRLRSPPLRGANHLGAGVFCSRNASADAVHVTYVRSNCL